MRGTQQKRRSKEEDKAVTESQKYRALFEPIKIGKVEVKNRVAMAPMGHVGATHDGQISEQMTAWFTARAKGGVGLIITGGNHTNPDAAEVAVYRNPRLYDRSHIYGHSEMVEVVHSFGAKMFAQISPGPGRQGRYKAPSAIPFKVPAENVPQKAVEEHKKRGLVFQAIMEGPVPPVLTRDEIVWLEDMLANAAELARMSNYDGVEFHTAHGYLGHQFLSPRSNKRDDEYGGSLENRMRFLTNALLKAREKVGRDYCIGFRISGDEHMPGGLAHDEVKQICKKMEELGADFVDLSDGSYEALYRMFPDDDGSHNLEHAESLKSVLKIPVITPAVHDLDLAEAALKSGRTDMIGQGRALIADPNWANKIAEGKRPVKCILCNIGCVSRIAQASPIRCMVNPQAGFERYDPKYRLSPPFKKNWQLY